MSRRHRLALFIFRRDLRLDDNSGLLAALEASERVIPCFIFDPRQVEPHAYRSSFGLNFMCASLMELQTELAKLGAKLYLFSGQPHEVISRLHQELQFDAVYVNEDYTPFSRFRDEQLANICASRGVTFEQAFDLLLTDPGKIEKKEGGPYTVFTPFSKRALLEAVEAPRINRFKHYYNSPIAGSDSDLAARLATPEGMMTPALRGGRREALHLISQIERLINYEEERNFPAVDSSTRLSAHHKFGTCSVREVYHYVTRVFGKAHTLIKELLWRDFFTHITFHYPHVFKGAFHEEYDRLAWENDEQMFNAWCEGMTGYPLVDAGMRELNATGFMHNRVRMVTASFLTKDLLVDWRWGERYFASRLIDYDPAVNNGNWQWSASTGCDAQPYFRIFNPWIQQRKFDAECVYIKRWVPELRHFNSSEIHALEKGTQTLSGYPAPIVNHAESKVRAEEMFSILKMS